MKITFTGKKLEKLYTTGSSGKYKLDKVIIENFFEVIGILESAKDIHDLWKMPSLNFESLKGCSNRYSARLNRKWRLEMTIEWIDDKMTVGIIAIDKISDHYGD